VAETLPREIISAPNFMAAADQRFSRFPNLFLLRILTDFLPPPAQFSKKKKHFGDLRGSQGAAGPANHFRPNGDWGV